MEPSFPDYVLVGSHRFESSHWREESYSEGLFSISEAASHSAHPEPEPTPEPEPAHPEPEPEPPAAQPDIKDPTGSVQVEQPEVYLVKVKLTERWLNDYKSQGSNKYDRLTKQITNSVGFVPPGSTANTSYLSWRSHV